MPVYTTEQPSFFNQETHPTQGAGDAVRLAESAVIRKDVPRGYESVAAEEARRSVVRERRRAQTKFNTRMDRLLATGYVAALLAIAGVVFWGKSSHATSETSNRPAQPINIGRMIAPASNLVLTPGLKPTSDLGHLPGAPQK